MTHTEQPGDEWRGTRCPRQEPAVPVRQPVARCVSQGGCQIGSLRRVLSRAAAQNRKAAWRRRHASA